MEMSGPMLLEKYADKIKKLSNKDSYDKYEILNEDFLLYENRKMKIYYAPHNEYINKQAKIFIVGITPGWTQTNIAFSTANKNLNNGYSYEEVSKECKQSARFAGSMRNNLVDMLNELQLNKCLNLSSCSQMFSENCDLMHTTSLIPYPVFINDKNYTGTNPKILESVTLFKYVEDYFYKEVKELEKVLIIPLGIAVEEVLLTMVSKDIIKEEQCLFGFPHPSGANGHRKKQFLSRKEQLTNKIKRYYEKL